MLRLRRSAAAFLVRNRFCQSLFTSATDGGNNNMGRPRSELLSGASRDVEALIERCDAENDWSHALTLMQSAVRREEVVPSEASFRLLFALLLRNYQWPRAVQFVDSVTAAESVITPVTTNTLSAHAQRVSAPSRRVLLRTLAAQLHESVPDAASAGQVVETAHGVLSAGHDRGVVLDSKAYVSAAKALMTRPSLWAHALSLGAALYRSSRAATTTSLLSAELDLVLLQAAAVGAQWNAALHLHQRLRSGDEATNPLIHDATARIQAHCRVLESFPPSRWDLALAFQRQLPQVDKTDANVVAQLARVLYRGGKWRVAVGIAVTAAQNITNSDNAEQSRRSSSMSAVSAFLESYMRSTILCDWQIALELYERVPFQHERISSLGVVLLRMPADNWLLALELLSSSPAQQSIITGEDSSFGVWIPAVAAKLRRTPSDSSWHAALSALMPFATLRSVTSSSSFWLVALALQSLLPTDKRSAQEKEMLLKSLASLPKPSWSPDALRAFARSDCWEATLRFSSQLSATERGHIASGLYERGSWECALELLRRTCCAEEASNASPDLVKQLFQTCLSLGRWEEACRAFGEISSSKRSDEISPSSASVTQLATRELLPLLCLQHQWCSALRLADSLHGATDAAETHFGRFKGHLANTTQFLEAATAYDRFAHWRGNGLWIDALRIVRVRPQLTTTSLTPSASDNIVTATPDSIDLRLLRDAVAMCYEQTQYETVVRLVEARLVTAARTFQTQTLYTASLIRTGRCNWVQALALLQHVSAPPPAAVAAEHTEILRAFLAEKHHVCAVRWFVTTVVRMRSPLTPPIPWNPLLEALEDVLGRKEMAGKSDGDAIDAARTVLQDLITNDDTPTLVSERPAYLSHLEALVLNSTRLPPSAQWELAAQLLLCRDSASPNVQKPTAPALAQLVFRVLRESKQWELAAALATHTPSEALSPVAASSLLRTLTDCGRWTVALNALSWAAAQRVNVPASLARNIAAATCDANSNQARRAQQIRAHLDFSKPESVSRVVTALARLGVWADALGVLQTAFLEKRMRALPRVGGAVAATATADLLRSTAQHGRWVECMQVLTACSISHKKDDVTAALLLPQALVAALTISDVTAILTACADANQLVAMIRLLVVLVESQREIAPQHLNQIARTVHTTPKAQLYDAYSFLKRLSISEQNQSLRRAQAALLMELGHVEVSSISSPPPQQLEETVTRHSATPQPPLISREQESNLIPQPWATTRHHRFLHRKKDTSKHVAQRERGSETASAQESALWTRSRLLALSKFYPYLARYTPSQRNLSDVVASKLQASDDPSLKPFTHVAEKAFASRGDKIVTATHIHSLWYCRDGFRDERCGERFAGGASPNEGVEMALGTHGRFGGERCSWPAT